MIAAVCANLIAEQLTSGQAILHPAQGEPEDVDMPGGKMSEHFALFGKGPFRFSEPRDLLKGISHMRGLLSPYCREIAQSILESPYRGELVFHDCLVPSGGVYTVGRAHDDNEVVSARVVTAYDIMEDTLVMRIDCAVKKPKQ